MGAAPEVPTAVLGRPVRARLRSAALAAWLRDHWDYPEHAPAAHRFAVVMEEIDPRAAPAVPAGEPLVAAMPGLRVEWWRDGDAWHAGGPAAGVRLRLADDGAEILVWGAGRGRRAMPFGALYMALCEALRASGLLPVHAAVAAPPGDGGAVALVGPSGAGKSTTLLRLVARGWTPLAEDLSWLDPTDGTLYGWDRGVRLWPGTAAMFVPWLADAPWIEGPDGKQFLAWRALGAPARRTAPLSALTALERDPGGAPAWERLTLRDAVRVLWEATGVPLSEPARRAAEAAAPAVLARVLPWRLRLGAGELPAWPGA
ncbi:MAG TPA: hypothetical protein VF158_04135 [Longimicrobiales bacterium]